MLIFAPEIALRVEHSNSAQNPNFRAVFFNAHFQYSRLLHKCGKFLQLNGRARGLELLEKQMADILFHLNW